MSKFLYSDFDDVSEILETMLNDTSIKKTITRANLYSFWNKIIPEKFKNRSKPYSMIGKHVMNIACENHIVAQELTMIKNELLKKFEPYSKSLKIQVHDFKFDPKKWTNN